MDSEQLADILSEFARTMLTDFPIQRILDHLVGRIVEVMPVDGAGVALISPGGSPRYIAASNTTAMDYERLQSDLGQGPCMDAYASGQPVCVEDTREETRFPEFTQGALGAGLAAVFAFPLRHGKGQLGALDLYRNTPGPLESSWLKSAQTLADVAAAYLINAGARSELEASLLRSREAALHDPLTGLANRVLLFEFLDQALRRDMRWRKFTTILFCDIDRFKCINDVFGHRVGDELLVAVAERLTGLMRPSDILARLGGDEFVILCDGLGAISQATMIAQRAIDSFHKPFTLSVGPVEVTLSIGITIDGDSSLASDDLLNDADRAMYEAKRNGGAQWQFFESSRHRPLGQEQFLGRLLLPASTTNEED
ncbi:MAG TPA: sensor domain-containing diguanylate cyclase [Acidimicrobiales bacterium]